MNDMLTVYATIGGLLLIIILLMFYAMSDVPTGYQDDTGFHEGKEPLSPKELKTVAELMQTAPTPELAEQYKEMYLAGFYGSTHPRSAILPEIESSSQTVKSTLNLPRK